MRALALVVLLASTAFGQDLPDDAPVAADVAPVEAVKPEPDLCLNKSDQMLLAKRLAALQGENDHLRKTVSGGIPVWVVVVAGVLVAGAGVAAGYGIAKAGTPKPQP